MCGQARVAAAERAQAESQADLQRMAAALRQREETISAREVALEGGPRAKAGKHHSAPPSPGTQAARCGLQTRFVCKPGACCSHSPSWHSANLAHTRSFSEPSVE